VKDCMKIDKQGVHHYFLSGQEVSKERYEEYYPALVGSGLPRLGGWSRPMEMDSLAVHPEDIPEQMEKDRRHGLLIDYTSEGLPIIHSESQKRQYMRSRNPLLHDRNSYS
jgi:hypothetical protein